MIEPPVVTDPGTNLAEGWDTAGPEALRQVLRRFAAGVTVVTTISPDGRPAGMTATAFTSVSIEPPIVLCCLNASSRTTGAVLASEAFAVNVLSAGQEECARRFAQRVDDKFSGIEWHPGPLGLPILEGTVATVACRVRSVTEAGTHRIVLGDVVACRHGSTDALLYLDGRYGSFGSPA
jgi:flavin reductase (DIM6/NTAB) family NADH-FMN oxidoreductase RutF